MRNIFSLLISLVLLLSSSFCVAEEVIKIGVVDLNILTNDALVYKDFLKKIELKRKQDQESLTKENQDISNKARDLEKQKSVLAPEVFEKKNNALQAEVNAFQKRYQTLQSEGEAAHGKAVKVIEDTLAIIFKDYAKRNQIALILPSAATLYSLDSMNITKEIIKELDNKIKTVDFK